MSFISNTHSLLSLIHSYTVPHCISFIYSLLMDSSVTSITMLLWIFLNKSVAHLCESSCVVNTYMWNCWIKVRNMCIYHWIVSDCLSNTKLHSYGAHSYLIYLLKLVSSFKKRFVIKVKQTHCDFSENVLPWGNIKISQNLDC